jgi:putative spermidine/putrescine transport system permease protein
MSDPVPSAAGAARQSQPTSESRGIGLLLLDAIEAVRARLFPNGGGRLTPWLFLLPALLVTGLLVVGMVPLVDASLRTLDRATFRMGESWSLANFATLVDRPVYAVLAWRTLGAALAVTVLTLAIALPYAWLMVRTPKPWLKKLLLVSLFLPFFIGQVVRAYGWLIVLGQQGLVNTLLASLGLPAVAILYTLPGVVLGLVQYMLPFAVLMLAPAFTAVGEEVELASASLGATPARTFLHVVLPLVKPGLVAASVVVFTLSLTDFAMPAIMGGGRNDFVANGIYDAFFRLSDPGLGGALAIVLTLLGTSIAGLMLALFVLGTLGYVRRNP